MIEQVIDFNMESFLTPILDVGIMVAFIILMIYLYGKYRIFPLILLITLMSLIIGVISIQLSYNPFTPFFQIFFICINIVFFLQTSMEYMKKKRAEDK